MTEKPVFTFPVQTDNAFNKAAIPANFNFSAPSVVTAPFKNVNELNVDLEHDRSKLKSDQVVNFGFN